MPNSQSQSSDPDVFRVKCGGAKGTFSLEKYVASISTGKLGKCVRSDSSQEWITPTEFESLGGKKARKWRESITLCDKGCNVGFHLRSLSQVSSPAY